MSCRWYLWKKCPHFPPSVLLLILLLLLSRLVILLHASNRSPKILDRVVVDAYGAETPLNQVASVKTTRYRT